METEVTESPALVAAMAEHKEISTNPQHPMYAGYQRGDESVAAHLHAFYARAVPQTATPSAPSVPRNPADQALIEHARVMSDKTHEHYAGYHRNPQDPAAVAFVDALYKNTFSNTEAVSPSPSEPDPAGLSQVEREAAEDARELAVLRADWSQDGDSFEAGVQEAKEAAGVIVAADPALFQEAARRLGDAMGLRILRMFRPYLNI